MSSINYLETDQLKFSKSFADLESQDNRTRCPKCNNKRKYYCYDCLVAIGGHEPPKPIHHLPVQVHIIRHKSESRSKSSIIPLKLAYPEDVFLYEFTQPNRFDITETEGSVSPSFPPNFDWEHTALLFPEEGVSKTVDEIVRCSDSRSAQVCDVIKNIVVIDSTWSTALQVIKRTREMGNIGMRIKLGSGNRTIFWRHQKIDRSCLATCEAIYVLMRELWDVNETVYDHRYDDVLYYYVFVHSLINDHYRTTKRHKGHLPEYALVDN